MDSVKNKQEESPAIEKLPPAVRGETWFVRRPGSLIVDEMYVVDMTPATCLLQDVLRPHVELRYKNSQVEFVEQSDRVYRGR